jgi:hypothetical protein
MTAELERIGVARARRLRSPIFVRRHGEYVRIREIRRWAKDVLLVTDAGEFPHSRTTPVYRVAGARRGVPTAKLER